MKKQKIFKAGAITFILLGLLHLAAHFGMEKDAEVSQFMQAFKIQLFGEHDLLKFHEGFSIMMGFMFAAYGLQQSLCAEFIIQSKKALLSCILITACSFIIGLFFFHILAYGLIIFSLTCFAVSAYLPHITFQKSTV